MQNDTIQKILLAMHNDISKNYRPRAPEPNESPEDRDMLDNIYETDFFMVESFKLGFNLAKEVFN